MFNRARFLLIILASAILLLLIQPQNILGYELHEDAATDDKKELDQFLKVLDHLTDKATRARLNADYVPGIITILYGDDLEAMGIRTVGEALNLAPGINLSLTSYKVWKTVIRGMPKSFASGHMKILLNDMSLTTTFGIDLIPNMPIEQVERIELIRGPGSVIHGEFAYAGVMNIITRKQGNQVFGSISNDNSCLGGGIFSWNIPEKKLDMSLNLGFMSTPGSGESNMTHLLSLAPGFDERAPDFEPGNIYDLEQDYDRKYNSSIFNLNYKNLSFKTHYIQNNQNNSYDTSQWGGLANQLFKPFPSMQANLYLGWLNRKYDAGREDYDPLEYSRLISNAWVYEFNYTENLLHGGLNISWKGWEKQTILLAYALAKINLEDIRHNGLFETTFFEDRDRLVNSITLEDQIKINNQLMLIAGLRYDHYNDIGEKLTPRLGLVYRMNRQENARTHHILKAQYAQSFRPPSFLEILDKNDEFEKIDTCELGYIYRSLYMDYRATLFYSSLQTKIDEIPPGQGLSRFHVKGGELELKRQLIPKFLKLNANLSYVTTQAQDHSRKIPGLANWLSNIGLICQPYNNLSLSAQSRYVGDHNGQGSNNELDNYHTVNITINLFNMMLKGLTIRAGIHNLFKEEFPIPQSTEMTVFKGESGYSNENYNSDKRLFWIKFSSKL